MPLVADLLANLALALDIVDANEGSSPLELWRLNTAAPEGPVSNRVPSDLVVMKPRLHQQLQLSSLGPGTGFASEVVFGALAEGVHLLLAAVVLDFGVAVGMGALVVTGDLLVQSLQTAIPTSILSQRLPGVRQDSLHHVSIFTGSLSKVRIASDLVLHSFQHHLQFGSQAVLQDLDWVLELLKPLLDHELAFLLLDLDHRRVHGHLPLEQFLHPEVDRVLLGGDGALGAVKEGGLDFER